MNKPLIVGVVLGVMVLISGGVYLLWPEPEPEPEPEALEDKDTGLDRFETEELMRTIGYIQ
jgi:hypothetical protein